MAYIIAILIGILLPPCLIGISSASDKQEKIASISIFGLIVFFLQVSWGRNATGWNILAIFITLLIILLSAKFPHIAKKVVKILLGTFNNFLNEMRDPLMSTRETILLLLRKDIVIMILGIVGLFNPAQCTIMILGTPFYLIVVEILLQGNTELKTSWLSFIKSLRLRIGLSSARETEENLDEDYVDIDELGDETVDVPVKQPKPKAVVEEVDISSISKPNMSPSHSQIPPAPSLHNVTPPPPTGLNVTSPPPMRTNHSPQSPTGLPTPVSPSNIPQPPMPTRKSKPIGTGDK